MFGIPHTGANICGSHLPANETKLNQELCLRWIQLATFYPFARFTYDVGQAPTEPYNLEGDYLTAANASMIDRYQYIRLMYTCLFEANQEGESCFEPLFFYFPFNSYLYNNTDDSFMVAGALKVTPILQPLGGNTTF